MRYLEQGNYTLLMVLERKLIRYMHRCTSPVGSLEGLFSPHTCRSPLLVFRPAFYWSRRDFCGSSGPSPCRRGHWPSPWWAPCCWPKGGDISFCHHCPLPWAAAADWSSQWLVAVCVGGSFPSSLSSSSHGEPYRPPVGPSPLLNHLTLTVAGDLLYKPVVVAVHVIT